MKIYFAPLEGITGFAYRNAHFSAFGGDVDKYFAPFLSPNYTHHLKGKEREDVLPENNEGVPLVPQILSNHADDFLWAAEELASMGYQEINLNLGCPMPTVARRGRGAGQLADLDALDRFFEDICQAIGKTGKTVKTGNEERTCEEITETEKTEIGKTEIEKEDAGKGGKACGEDEICEKKACGNPAGWRLTVKTRIGVDDAAHAEELCEVYSRYPISELIVHPRTRRDLYGGSPDLDAFQIFYENCPHPVVYNGDLFAVRDCERIRERFPRCEAVMLGRGLLANPALAREIRGGAPLSKAELKAFHDAVYEACCRTLPGTAPLLGRMKELWPYMGRNFQDADRLLKQIRKAKTPVEYQAAVRTLFTCGDFR